MVKFHTKVIYFHWLVEEEKIFIIKKQVYFDAYTGKFDKIILETQIQLRKRFGDFEAFPLKNLCALFDFKLWLKSFNDDKK